MNNPIQDVIDASGPYLEYVVDKSIKTTRRALKFTLKIPVDVCQDQIRETLASDLVNITIFRVGVNWVVNLSTNQ
jgi:hypothetical protein